MRRIAIESVVPGMTVAQHVYPADDYGGLPLLAADVVITEAILERLTRANIKVVYIDDELSEGIEPYPPITDEVRSTAVTTLRRTFDTLRGSHGILTDEALDDINATMSAIITEISSRRNLLVGLSDLNQFGGDRMQHAINVCVVGCALARHHFEQHGWRDFKGNFREDLLPDRLQKLGIGLLLQDIGSLAIPDSIWEKRGILSAEERMIMQMHPQLGVEMLEGSDVSPLTKVTIAQHHERYDGSGYPRGLRGDEIHDHGHVAAIADAYVTLCDQQHDGQKAFAPHEAYRMIVNARGKLFHPTIVDSFETTIAPYGPGTTVLLSDGKHAIVVANTKNEPLYPVVRVTHDRDGLQFVPPIDVNLSHEKQISVEEATSGLPTDLADPLLRSKSA